MPGRSYNEEYNKLVLHVKDHDRTFYLTSLAGESYSDNGMKWSFDSWVDLEEEHTIGELEGEVFEDFAEEYNPEPDEFGCVKTENSDCDGIYMSWVTNKFCSTHTEWH